MSPEFDVFDNDAQIYVDDQEMISPIDIISKENIYNDISPDQVQVFEDPMSQPIDHQELR